MKNLNVNAEVSYIYAYRSLVQLTSAFCFPSSLHHISQINLHYTSPRCTQGYACDPETIFSVLICSPLKQRWQPPLQQHGRHQPQQYLWVNCWSPLFKSRVSLTPAWRGTRPKLRLLANQLNREK